MNLGLNEEFILNVDLAGFIYMQDLPDLPYPMLLTAKSTLKWQIYVV